MNLRNRFIIEAQGNLEMADSESESNAGDAVANDGNESSVGGAVEEDGNESNAGVAIEDNEYVHNNQRPRNADPQALGLLDSISERGSIYDTLSVIKF